MKLFPTLFSLSLALISSVFLPDKVVIAKSNSTISQANQVNSNYQKLLEIGSFRFNAKDMDGAIASYKEAREISKQQGNVFEEVLALEYVARVYYSKGEYSQSENFNQECLRLLQINSSRFTTSEQRIRRDRQQASLLIGLGLIYKDIGEYDKASEQFKSSVTLSQKFSYLEEFQHLHFQPRFELAFIYTKQKKYSEAISLFEEGIVLAKKTGNRGWESTFFVGLGSAYIQSGNLKVGMQFMNQARSMNVFSDNPESREQINQSFESLDVEINRVSGLASFLEGSVNLLKRSTRELRQAYQIVSNDSRFSVISEFADSIEEVTVQFTDLSGFLKDGDLASVVKVSGLLANVLTKFASYSARLNLLMEQMESQPSAFRRLMNSRVLPSIEDVVNNLDELVEKFGGSKGNEKSQTRLKKNWSSLKLST